MGQPALQNRQNACISPPRRARRPGLARSMPPSALRAMSYADGAVALSPRASKP